MIIAPGTPVNLSVTASSIVCDGPCRITGILISPAAAASEIQIYDALTSVSTALKVEVKVAASVGTVAPFIGAGLQLNTGATVVVTGAGAKATVIYSRN